MGGVPGQIDSAPPRHLSSAVGQIVNFLGALQTPTSSICAAHGYLAGEQPHCPACGAACEVWTRVMGYHRPAGCGIVSGP